MPDVLNVILVGQEYDVEGRPVWPEVAVIGIAGEVKKNIVRVTNVPHWPPAEGLALQQACDIKIF